MKNRGYFKIKKKYLKAASAKKIDFRKATSIELEEVRKTIRVDLKKERRKLILTLILSIIVSAEVIYGFITLLNTTL